MKKVLPICILIILCIYTTSGQNTTNFNPVKDNSIYSESNSSNGTGELYSGKTRTGNNRRALMEFDISSIPVGSTITNVTLKVNVSNVAPGAGTQVYNIYQITKEWGEGSSFGTGSGGVAVAPDATWNDAMLGTVSWTSPGGDFTSTSIVTHSLSGSGNYTFASTTDFVNSVQSWLDNSSTNHGIILIGDETQSQTARQFNSRETNPGEPPILSVTWTAPLSVNEFSENILSIYPNPSNSIIHLKNLESSNIQSMTITSILGKQIFNFSVKESSIDVSNLNTGMYFLHLVTNNGKHTKRFIKQ